MRSIVCVLAIGACLFGPAACDKQPSGPVVQAEKDDPRLIAAEKTAHKRWPEFVEAMKNRTPNTAYAVKSGFKTRDGGVEHMWIQVQSIDGDRITGKLDNIPQGDVAVKQGDIVTIDLQEMTDWMIARGRDNIIGGFSIKALQQIEAERKKP